MAVNEEKAKLGMSPEEDREITWIRKTQRMMRDFPEKTPAGIRTLVKGDFAEKVLSKAPRELWGKEDQARFYSNVFSGAGIPETRRVVTPRGAREMSATKRFEANISRLGYGVRLPEEGAAVMAPGAEGGERVSLQESIRQTTAASAAEKQELSSRALSTMMVQKIGRKFGPWGKIGQREVGIKAAEKVALHEAAAAERMVGEYKANVPTLVSAKAASVAPTATVADVQKYAAVRLEFTNLAKATREQVKTAKLATEAHADLAAGVTNAADTAQHFAASFVGGVAGGFVGAMAGMIAQPMIQAVSMAVEKIGGPIADQMLGFSGTRARVMTGLAEATTQQGGLAAQAFAGQYQNVPTVATSPMSAPIIAQAETIAASKELEKYRDLYRTDRGMPGGIGGFSPAVTSTQGPLGSPLLADYKSITELIGSEFHAYSGAANPAAPGYVPNRRGANPEDTAWVEHLNALISYGAGTEKGQKAPYEIGAAPAGENKEDKAAREKAMADAGLGAVTNAGYAVVDSFGNVVAESKKLTEAANYVSKSFTRINPEQYVEQNRPQWRAQIEGAALQNQLQVQTVIPIQRFMDYITNPPLAAGTGILPSANVGKEYAAQGYDATKGLVANMPPLDSSVAASYDALTASINKSQAALSGLSEKGRKALQDLNVPQGTITQIEQIGLSIKAKQEEIGGIQANINWTQHNHDAAIANRTLTDMKQLTGQIGKNSSDNVGYYERQLLLINRASTALSLQLQQRQITTQQAIAGFAVQGDTPEIRMARRKEAMLEAEIANKQLGYSKQAFGTEIKLVDATNMRQLKDAAYALTMLERTFHAGIKIGLTQQDIENAKRFMDSLVPDAQAFIGLKVGYETMMISIATDLAGRADKAVADILGKSIKPAIDSLLSGLPAWLGGTSGTPKLPTESDKNTDPTPKGWYPLVNPGSTPTPSTPVDPAWYRPRSLGPQDRAEWGSRLGITPKSAAGGRGADMGNPSAGSAFPNPVAVTTNNTTNNNQKVEISPVYNITLPSLDQEQVADLTTKVVKSINTALALVGLRPVAR